MFVFNKEHAKLKNIKTLQKEHDKNFIKISWRMVHPEGEKNIRLFDKEHTVLDKEYTYIWQRTYLYIFYNSRAMYTYIIQ